MFVTPAYAQSAPAAGGDFLGGQLGGMLIPLVLMFVIFYFLLIRPQQRRLRDHQALLKAIKPRDIVVTTGGIVGKVTKANENDQDVEVEIADGVKVKVVRGMISEVRGKPETARDKG